MRLADVLDYSFALVILIVWFLSRKTDKLIVVGNLLKIVLNYEKNWKQNNKKTDESLNSIMWIK